MLCRRCEQLPATHLAQSDLIKMPVCDDCAQVANQLPRGAPGELTVSPLPANGATRGEQLDDDNGAYQYEDGSIA